MSSAGEGSNEGADTRDELRRQIDEVALELGRRETRLYAVEAAIVSLRGRLKEVSLSRGYLRGDAAWLATAGAHRGALEKEISARQKESHEVFEDVQRARERLKLLREELQAVAHDQKS